MSMFALYYVAKTSWKLEADTRLALGLLRHCATSMCAVLRLQFLYLDSIIARMYRHTLTPRPPVLFDDPCLTYGDVL